MGSVYTKVRTDKRESGTESASQISRLQQRNGICTRRHSNANNSQFTSVNRSKNRRTRHSEEVCSTDDHDNSTTLRGGVNGNVSAICSGRNVKFGDTTMIYTPMDWSPGA